MVTFNKNYSNGEVTVHWKPDVCVHSGNCSRQLSSVFNTRLKPWINVEGAGTETIINAVEGCPSGALTWSNNKREIHEE